MTLEMQNAKALEDLEIKYEMDLNEMKERHARELKQLEQSYEHNKAQFIKDYKVCSLTRAYSNREKFNEQQNLINP